MDTLTSLVLRHRRIAGLIWLLLLLAGGGASAMLSSHLSQSFDIPGTPSAAAARAIVARYHNGGTGTPLVPVVRLPPGRTVYQRQMVAGLRTGFAAVAAAGPGGNPRTSPSTPGPLGAAPATVSGPIPVTWTLLPAGR